MAIQKGGVTLTARQQKRYVQELTGWSTEQYNKEYDKLRNRVRAYERATGAPKGRYNVADLLARNARGEYFAKREGREYTPTNLYSAVQAAPSISSGRELSEAQTARITGAAREALNKQYAGFLKHSIYGGEAFEKAVRHAEEDLGRPLTVEEYARFLRVQAERATAAKLSRPQQELRIKLVEATTGKEVPPYDIKQIQT